MVQYAVIAAVLFLEAEIRSGNIIASVCYYMTWTEDGVQEHPIPLLFSWKLILSVFLPFVYISVSHFQIINHWLHCTLGMGWRNNIEITSPYSGALFGFSTYFDLPVPLEPGLYTVQGSCRHLVSVRTPLLCKMLKLATDPKSFWCGKVLREKKRTDGNW